MGTFDFYNEQIASLHAVMYDSLGYFFMKDLHGRYLYANKNLLKDAGRSQPRDLLGKTDMDTPWAAHAQNYSGHNRSIAQEQRCKKGQVLLTTHKRGTIILSAHGKPFYEDGTVIGSCGASLEIPLTAVEDGVAFTSHMEFVDRKSNKVLNTTTRQKEVLYWLLQGGSAKEIEQKLCVSRRTVEHHIGAIKANNSYLFVKEILLHVHAIYVIP